jgi:transcriptional regulator with XRE-family HTH domain
MGRRKANGDKIKNFREDRGVRQDALAEKAGISAPYLCNIEAGRKPATPYVIRKIAEALGVSIAEISDPAQAKSAEGEAVA